MKRSRPKDRRDGFTLIELLLGLIISAVIMTGIYRIFGTCQSVQSAGIDMADAQQNARVAMDALERDLRLAGYGIPTHVQTPILVASEYRVTFVKDLDDDGLLDPIQA